MSIFVPSGPKKSVFYQLSVCVDSWVCASQETRAMGRDFEYI